MRMRGSSSSALTDPSAPAPPALPVSRRKRSRGSIAAGIVAVIALLGLLSAPFWLLKASIGLKHHQDSSNFAAANHPGDQVHDAGMSFVVNSVRCGATAIGSYESQHGQFCQMSLTVRNDGPVPVRFNAISQRAMGSQGGFYIPDPAADAIVNKASDTIPDPSDPEHTGEAKLSPAVVAPLRHGQSRDYTVVYDIPVGVRLTEVHLHADEYSTGSVVLLSR